MLTRAAVLTGPGSDWEVVELELDPPSRNEILVRIMAAGLCHSDEHLKYSTDAFWPMVGGHEGAGVVEAIGEGVTQVSSGDHILCSFIPACGRCRWCSTGRSYLCDDSPDSAGAMRDGTYRFRLAGRDVGAMDSLGTFARHTVISADACIRIDRDVPFEIGAILSCAVPTGWGAAVRAGGVTLGDVVVVYGCGGVGMNAVLGAVAAGADAVVVVEPNEAKHDLASRMGASAVYSDADAAKRHAKQITEDYGADVAIVTVGVVDESVVRHAYDSIRKGGKVVLIGVHNDFAAPTIQLSGSMLAVECKQIVGSLYGSCNPRSDIPHLIRMYRDGRLKLWEQISARYPLDEIRQGYADMHSGKNIRGVIVNDGFDG